MRKRHWNNVFKSSDYTQVLWHQNNPKKSLELIQNYSNKDAKIIDVGCGASCLIDNLLKYEYKNIILLDTSKTSLDIVKKRVKNRDIKFICDDILNFTPQEKFDIWHDRAVFHFLTSKKERQKYFEVLKNTLKNEVTAIISTFNINSSTQCAGLDIVQYNEQKMKEKLPCGLELTENEDYTHITPKESEQGYIYFIVKKS